MVPKIWLDPTAESNNYSPVLSTVVCFNFWRCDFVSIWPRFMIMIWILQALILMLVLVALIEGIRTGGYLPKAGLWLPILLLGGLAFFSIYSWRQISFRLSIIPGFFLMSGSTLKDPADELVRLEAMRSELSEKLALCQEEEDFRTLGPLPSFGAYD